MRALRGAGRRDRASRPSAPASRRRSSYRKPARNSPASPNCAQEESSWIRDCGAEIVSGFRKSRQKGWRKRAFGRPSVRTTLGDAMKPKKLVKEASEIAERFRITDGGKFRLKDYDPADTNGLKDKKKALRTLENGVTLLSHFQ